MNTTIIGRGRVGNALAHSLAKDRTFRVATVGKRLTPAAIRNAEVIIIAVPDTAIESVASAIAPSLRRGAVVIHCAGARPVAVLDACASRGAHIGIMHPLVSFPSATRHPRLSGMTFVVCGSRQAVAAARKVANACEAHAVVGATDDPTYHAAAALAANGAAALAHVAVGLFEKLGMSRRDAQRAVGGLVQSVGDNVARLGTPTALTGPVARGDRSTVSQHRAALRKAHRKALAAYDAVLPVIVQTAEAQGLQPQRARAIRRLIARR
ncbi:MAG: DUF2520 domain-containing protein [Polyangiales bacterium]